MDLKVKPVLVYNVAQKREATSWRAWGGIQTEEDALKEVRRIEQELERLASAVSFPLTILPLSSLRSEEEASRSSEEIASADVALLYAAGGGRSVWYVSMSLTHTNHGWSHVGHKRAWFPRALLRSSLSCGTDKAHPMNLDGLAGVPVGCWA
jgi:hypothetical protein